MRNCIVSSFSERRLQPRRHSVQIVRLRSHGNAPAARTGRLGLQTWNKYNSGDVHLERWKDGDGYSGKSQELSPANKQQKWNNKSRRWSPNQTSKQCRTHPSGRGALWSGQRVCIRISALWRQQAINCDGQTVRRPVNKCSSRMDLHDRIWQNAESGYSDRPDSPGHLVLSLQ